MEPLGYKESSVMQDINSLPWLMAERTDILWGQPCITVKHHHRPQKMGMLAVQLIFARMVCWHLQQSGCQLGDHWFSIPWQCNMERDCGFGVQNAKAGYRNGPSLSFQTNPSSTCSILVASCMSRGSKETKCHLHTFYIGKGILHLVWWFGYMRLTSLVWSNCNLKADWYISDII